MAKEEKKQSRRKKKKPKSHSKTNQKQNRIGEEAKGLNRL